MMAAGFAELWRVSAVIKELAHETYLSTMGIVGERTVASSFRRCGRLPVFWSCSMTPTTMMSSMPWVSTFVASPPGEGGGESGTRAPLLSSKRKVGSRGGEFGDEDVDPEWERFCLFATCGLSGGERAARPGSAMPREGSDKLLRLVLYCEETMAM
jgi:hypothetical protein